MAWKQNLANANEPLVQSNMNPANLWLPNLWTNTYASLLKPIWAEFSVTFAMDPPPNCREFWMGGLHVQRLPERKERAWWVWKYYIEKWGQKVGQCQPFKGIDFHFNEFGL